MYHLNSAIDQGQGSRHLHLGSITVTRPMWMKDAPCNLICIVPLDQRSPNKTRISPKRTAIPKRQKANP